MHKYKQCSRCVCRLFGE